MRALLAKLAALLAALFMVHPAPQFGGTTVNLTCMTWGVQDIYDTPTGSMQAGFKDASSTFNYTTTTPSAAHVIGKKVTAYYKGDDGHTYSYDSTVPASAIQYKQPCANQNQTSTTTTGAIIL